MGIKFKDIDNLTNIIKNMRAIDDAKIEVGVMGSGGGQLMTYAMANEYGTNRAGKNHSTKIPERSYLRSTFDKKSAVNRALKPIDGLFTKGFNPRQALNVVGVTMTAEVQKTISSNVPPPNAPSTKAKKKSGKTLIDTGTLKQSIDYRVK
jgi:phage gpG-like protein